MSLLGLLVLGLAGASPVAADVSTLPTFTPGHHVYDLGKLLSPQSVTTAEALAAKIEAEGGGRVALCTADEGSAMPDNATVAEAWSVDGLLITGQGVFGTITIGPTLQAKLSTVGTALVNDFSTPGPQTTESWMLSTLARVEGFLRGGHVFDSSGVLDAAGRQQAESAATDLGSKLNATVYVDIAIAASDPATAAFFNGAGMSSDTGKSLDIALAVSDGQIGGFIDSSSELFTSYTANAPWKNDTLANETAAGQDVQGALLTAIDAVQQPPFIPAGAVPVIIFVVVVVIFSITAPFVWGPWLIRKLTGTSSPIQNGLPADAVIESIADTGVTVTMPSVGPNAPEYKLSLQVTPTGGGSPYPVEIKVIVPRVYIPMILPGAHIGVLVDPAKPSNVSIDFGRIGGSAADGDPAAPDGTEVAFDASGQPSAADVSAVVGAVRSGSLPTTKGSAAELLATGTRCTAVITTAQPLGKTVRDIDPSAEASHLNDPMWLFTVEVTLAGEAPFPAVFGHRVPLDKVGGIAPGVKLAVAVNLANRNQEVAIDWDKSPITA